MLTNPNLFINVQPMSIGEAIISVNKRTATRQGRGVLNLKTRKIIAPSPSVWNHVMYINQLEDVSFIKDITDSTISADITSGDIKNMEYFKYLDFLFISDEEMFMDIEELAKIVKGWVILHYPSGSICHNGTEYFKTTTKVVDNLNVLGAGDFFAASFITSMLNNSDDIKKCIEASHNNTKKLLLRRNNEQ